MKTHPKQAFDAIIAALEKDDDVRLVTRLYDPESFGNFHLAYWRKDRAVSIVLDRGQLFVCDDLQAERCRMVGDLFEADEHSVLATLGSEW